MDGYLATVPAGRRAVLSELRDACRALLTGFEESMRYGMPAYSRNGITEIAWASQKQYISLYVMRGEVLDAHREQLAHLSVGPAASSTVRAPRAADVGEVAGFSVGR